MQPDARGAEDMDLTPPEERRVRLLRRRVLIAALAGALLLVIGWYGAPPVRHAIKAWQSRRLAHEAVALIEKANWEDATKKARDAYQLDPAEPEAWRAIGRLLSQTGQNGPALDWWHKLEEAGTLVPDDRRQYAASALATGELATAAIQIDTLQKAGPTPADNLLAGQLAVRRQEGASAVDYAERTLRDNRAKPNEILAAALLVLSVTAPDSQPYISAWNRIEDLARDPANVMSLEALTFLAQQRSLAPQPASDESGTLSLGQNVATHAAATLTPGEIASRLENHPKARAIHHLLGLKLRAREEPARAGEFLDQAVERFRGGGDEVLIALNTWLYTEGRYQALLDVMPLERALHRRELYLQYLDALGAVGRVQDVRELLEHTRFRLDPVSEHMYLAAARRGLGEEVGAANEWERALEAANDPDRCLLLGGFAERATSDDIADRAYAQAISFAPKARAPYDARLRLAERRGQTARAKQVLHEIVRLWPADEHARNRETYLALLLGASGADAEKAARESEILAAQEPMNWQARATLALAQLRLGRPAAALDAFSGMKATAGSPVGPLAVRAVALDANGWKEGARGDARTLSTAQLLLPEERALLTPLLREPPGAPDT